jgi:hypothetical protein
MGPEIGTGGPDTGGTSQPDAQVDAGTSQNAGADALVAAPKPETCTAIRTQQPSEPTGVFTIEPPGYAGAPFATVCDMATSGGGWTLAFLKNSVDNGRYHDFGSAYTNVSALATSPAQASASDWMVPVAGWVDLNNFPYTELRLAGYENGAEVYSSKPIARSSLRLAFGQNGYFLFNDVNGYYWCGGDNAYTTDGVGQENQPAGAPLDCKDHTSLGDGWDFSEGDVRNTGLSICGGGSGLMTSKPGSLYFYYPASGAAQAIWVR